MTPRKISPLFDIGGNKPTTVGFIVVDVSVTPHQPLRLNGENLFSPAVAVGPTFFPIEEHVPAHGANLRTPREYSYRYSRKKLDHIILRHLNIISQMQKSKVTMNRPIVKNAATMILKIKPVKRKL